MTDTLVAGLRRETLSSNEVDLHVSQLRREALTASAGSVRTSPVVREVLHQGSGQALVHPTRLVREVLWATAPRRRQVIVNTN